MLGLRVFEKVVLVFLAGIAVCTLATLAVGFGAFESAYERLQLSRFKFLATETKVSIEYLLSVGLPLQPSTTLTEVIDTVRAESSDVDSVAILDATGQVIYSTDTGEIGERLPGLLTNAILEQRLGTPQAWTTGENSVAVLLVNGFDQVLGAILIRYETVDLVAVMERTLLFLGKLGLGIFAAAGVLVFLGVFAVLRQPSRAVVELTEQLDRLAGPDPACPAEPRPDEGRNGALGAAAADDRYLATLRTTFGGLKSYEARVTELDESV